MFKIIEKKNKKEKKEENNKKKESKLKNLQKKEHPFLDDLFFLLNFCFLILKLPIEILIYSFKFKPLYPFKKLFFFVKSHFFDKHKEVFILILLNTVIFLLLNVIIFISSFFHLTFFHKIIEFIFISSPSNYYLFNFSFLAHLELKHFLYNMLFLYFFGTLVNYRFNALKLYFLFGFILNILSFFYHYLLFFDPSYRSIGASGVIFAFSAISVIFFPFSFSLMPFLLFIFTQKFFYLPVFEIFKIKEEFSLINTPTKIDHLTHIFGFGLGLAFSLFYFNSFNKFKKMWFIFVVSFFLFLLFYITKIK